MRLTGFAIVCMLLGAVIVTYAGWTGVAYAVAGAVVTAVIEECVRRRAT